ncbi:hypothetical protein ACIGKR_23940 [Rhodococcus qingshengii]|uniref:hypothetical protein n=1 Tax=Rhodococcus qingshengii TaxID=334542 RepID=UPI0037C793C8
MLDPITFNSPVAFEDDGSVVVLIGNTKADNTGIEVRVNRWIEPNEPARVVMTLDLHEATNALEASFEFELPQVHDLHQALQESDNGIAWLLKDLVTNMYPNTGGHILTLLSMASKPRTNRKLRQLVDKALLPMTDLDSLPA